MNNEQHFIEFTKEMRKDYTILIPNMLPTHFTILENVFRGSNYNVELLRNEGPQVITEGLKYVHNDTCYPALLTTGQMIDALNSGRYDVNRTALIMTQTGGGCRASNYIHLIRKALKKAGYPQIPVISLNMSGLESHSGFKLTLTLVRQMVAGLAYGDVIMLLKNQIRPYEIHKGETQALCDKWAEQLSNMLLEHKGYSVKDIKRVSGEIAADFAKIKTRKTPKVKVGVVGEIYIKYSAIGNNHLEDFLAAQDCEYMVPGIMGFALFKVDNRLEDIKLYGGNPFKKLVVNILMKYLLKIEHALIDVIKEFPQFVPPGAYEDTKEGVRGVIGYGNKMGEGWLLPGEMIELTKQGYGNIVCAQPFGCLPNHISGKGMIRKIRELYPESNIVPIDYDPGATRVNQENRIKLMLAVARENLVQIEESDTQREVAFSAG